MDARRLKPLCGASQDGTQMTFAEPALCFAAAVVGAVAGVQLLFLLAKPRATITLDLTLKSNPMCPSCGEHIGAKHLLEEQKASDEFDVTMK